MLQALPSGPTLFVPQIEIVAVYVLDASQYAHVEPVFWSVVKLFEMVKGDIRL